MPSKKVHVKQYTVRAHDRIIRTRVYKFICQFCNSAVERETYATCCPKYGDVCHGNEKKCLRYQKQKR